MDFKLTDEQRDFVAAIRDFCECECGTPEQRERLTNGHTELYKKMADLGWLGIRYMPNVKRRLGAGPT